MAIGWVPTMALALAASSPAYAEDCVAASTNGGGEWHYLPVHMDLGGGARLSPATLPENTAAVTCPRQSIVPLPDDIRVLIEWGVDLFIANGPRKLWISAYHGRVEATVHDGGLSAGERSAVDAWRASAQARYTAAVARR